MRYFAAIAALIILASCAPVSAAEKLANGGFESGDTAGWASGPYGSASVVASGTYSVQAAEGSCFLDADLTRYDRWPKTVLSQVTTLPLTNTWYEITGWIYVHFTGDPVLKQASLSVDWGDGTIDRCVPSAYDAWGLVGTAHLARFSAPTSVTVYLEVYGDPLEPGDLALFDGISLYEYSGAVPEPGSLSALAVLLGAPPLAARRTRGR